MEGGKEKKKYQQENKNEKKFKLKVKGRLWMRGINYGNFNVKITTEVLDQLKKDKKELFEKLRE